MPEQNLISVPDPTVDPSLGEPRVWVQRIMILDTLGATKPLRDIKFRLGLNIIAAEIAGESDATPVGHDVGKTLLIRLIRYCLGDDHFADEEQTQAIANACENGYVLGQFRVNGTTWCVARPLAFGASWCRKTAQIDDVRTNDGSHAYKLFADALDGVTASCFSMIGLPNAEDRAATWRDLLGWISRDQDCNYSHWAKWRATQSQSGPRALTVTDAYLVMRMALGLINPQEKEALQNRARLAQQCKLSEKAIERATILRDAQHVDVCDLAEDLGLHAEVNLEVPLLGKALQDKATARVASLGALDASKVQRESITEKRLQRTQFERRLGAQEEQRDGIHTRHTVASQTLADLESQENEDIKDLLIGPMFACEFYGNNREKARAAGCPGFDAVSSDPLERARWQEDRLVNARSELDRLSQELETVNAAIVATNRDIARLDHAIVELEQDARGREENLRDTVQKWRSLEDAARTLVKRHDEVEEAEKQREVLRRQEEEAATRAAHFRATGTKESLRTLSHCYDAIVRQILSETASGKVKVDGNGLQPEISNVSSSGTTLRSCAKVVGFDLACLYASMCGVGHMPRLWIHDSPRAADTEDRLYHHLMAMVSDLEGKCTGTPTFQHIWTTTTPPPKHLNNDTYVRERLHARDPQGKLLRRDY
jgi:hypothetical protein